MPERVLTENPLAFLTRNAANPNVLMTFQNPSRVEVVEVTNLEFVRGAGGGNDPAGQWWIRRRELVGILATVRALPQRPNERRNLLQREIRNQTAVSVNWNALSAFWSMRILGQPLVGLRGQTKAQPVWDTSAGASVPEGLGNASERALLGGIVQYFFPKIPSGVVHYYGAAMGRTF